MSNRVIAAFPEVPHEIVGRGALSVLFGCISVALFGSIGSDDLDFLLEP